MNISNDIKKGNILQAIIKMAWPLMLINIINVFYSLADTYFVGQIDEMKVGAISLISPVINCGNAFASGLTASALALISQSIGADNEDKANHIATVIVEFCIIVGLIVGLGSIIFSNQILSWLKTPTELYDDTKRYLFGIAFDCLFLFIIQIYQAIRQSNGDSVSGVKINTISSLLNIILDPIFIFTFKLDILGAALATMLSKAIVMPLVFYSLMYDRDCTHIDFVKYKPTGSVSREIILTALPASIGYFISDFGFVIMSKEIVSYGSHVISGYGIGNRLANIYYIPLNAVGSALTPLIGQSLGAKNPEKTKQSFNTAMLLSAIISIVSTILGFATMKYMVKFFIKNASEIVVFEACRYAYYSIGTSFFMGWFNNLQAVFIGSGNTKYSLFVNVVRLWGLRIPMIWLFAKYTTLGCVGIWWSMILSNLVVCIVGQLWYSFSFTKRKLDKNF